MRKKLQKDLSSSITAVSSTTVYTTPFIPIDSLESYGFQIAYSGSPVATVSLEISMDPVPQNNASPGVTPPQPTNYDTAAGSSVSTSGINIITYDNIRTNANWVRLKWTNASSTGTVTSIQLSAKGSDV